MPNTLPCPHCQGVLSVDPEDAGHRLTCPHCHNDFLAPAKPTPSNVVDVTDIANFADATDPFAETPLANTPKTDTPANVASKSAQDDWLSLDEKPVMQSSSPAVTTGDVAGKGVSDVTDNAFGLGNDTEALPGVSNQPSVFGDELGLPDFLDEGPPVSNVAEDQYATEYRIKCMTCGTPTHVQASQAGSTVKCTDCHSPMKVPKPPKLPKQTKIEQVTAAPHPAAMFPATAPPVGPRPDPFRMNAEDLLDEAERAGADAEPPDLETPDIKEWLKNVFGIFFDIGVFAHWMVLSLMASVPAYLTLLSEHPMLVLGMFPYSILVVVLVAACAFAILESVANNQDHVEDWPAMDPMGWMSQMFVACAALMVPIIPAWLIGSVLFMPPLITIGLTLFSVFVLFPFVVLSMLDMDSPFVPFSAEVARSVNSCMETWGGTYFSSALLFVALFFVYIIFGRTGTPAYVFITLTTTIAAVFIYFAMVGRLAYAIGQSVNRPDHVDHEE